jgi:serine/threonine protein kinase
MPARIRIVQDLFQRVLETGTGLLDAECASDPSVRLEVLELVASYNSWSSDLPPPPEIALPQFGPYQCDSLLGAGGMGTVYRAHRSDGQFSQEVAVKVLRTSLRTEWYLQRFLAEREILARLNHRNIARLLDGGTTTAGEPYLVMELIEGEQIDDFVLHRNWPLRKRVESIYQAADALDYAHRNLVVHRDIKPGNVMIDAAGEVKLLDFGTSKLAGDDTTLPSVRALTPGYASPEQLRGEAVTTATDIYSLGLVAFAALTGTPPFPGGLQAIHRAQSEQALPQAPGIPKDLWTILGKAAAFDPSLRYASAGDFAADLRRFLDGKPVHARPQTFRYRLTRYVLRRPWAVSAGAAAGIAIISLSVLAAVRTTNLRQELQINERTIAFTQSLFERGVASSMSGAPNLKYRDQTVAQAIAEASSRMKSGNLPPAVEVRLRYWIAMLQVSVSDYSQMSDHAVRLRQLASTDRERAIADHVAGYDRAGKRDMAGAEKYYRDVLRYLEAHPEETMPDRFLVSGNLGFAAFNQGHVEEAAAMAKTCRAGAASRYGVAHSIYLRCTLLEIRLIDRQSRTDEAIKATQALIDSQDPANPPLELVDAYITLALSFGGSGNGDREVGAWRNALEIAKRYSRPEDHECIPVYRNYLFAVLKRKKDLDAIRTVESIAKNCEVDGLALLELKMGLTEAYKQAGRWEEAEASSRQALRVANANSKRGLGFICWAEQALAILLIDRRKNLEEARRLLEDSRTEYLAVFGPTNNVSVQRLTKRLEDLDKLTKAPLRR